jgi:hypothetical protein
MKLYSAEVERKIVLEWVIHQCFEKKKYIRGSERAGCLLTLDE